MKFRAKSENQSYNSEKHANAVRRENLTEECQN